MAAVIDYRAVFALQMEIINTAEISAEKRLKMIENSIRNALGQEEFDKFTR